MKNIGGGPVVIGGDNLPSPVQIGLTHQQNIGAPPGSGTTAVCINADEVQNTYVRYLDTCQTSFNTNTRSSWSTDN